MKTQLFNLDMNQVCSVLHLSRYTQLTHTHRQMNYYTI